MDVEKTLCGSGRLYRDDGEPQRHHRTEETADPFGAALLKEEKCEQHGDCQRQDELV
jgi:hypothetical protein